MGVFRIEALKVESYRALKELHLEHLTPLTVLLGPNGSGKSTIVDVFAFLSECFTGGLRRAWERRGGLHGLRSRGVAASDRTPIVIELCYRERPKTPLITYHLEIEEGRDGPCVAREWLAGRRGSSGKPFRFLSFENGEGSVIHEEEPDEPAPREQERLEASDTLAVNALGQLAKHPRVVSLRRFITGWYLSYRSADATRGLPEVRTLLQSPEPPPLTLIEHPERRLHPKLHHGLAERYREAASRGQLLVTTHSPYFVDGLRPPEVRVLHRDRRGYTRATRAADVEGVRELVQAGGLLGDLWMEGCFDGATRPRALGAG